MRCDLCVCFLVCGAETEPYKQNLVLQTEPPGSISLFFFLSGQEQHSDWQLWQRNDWSPSTQAELDVLTLQCVCVWGLSYNVRSWLTARSKVAPPPALHTPNIERQRRLCRIDCSYGITGSPHIRKGRGPGGTGNTGTSFSLKFHWWKWKLTLDWSFYHLIVSMFFGLCGFVSAVVLLWCNSELFYLKCMYTCLRPLLGLLVL